ncbi:hypothetical protein [Halococcus sp. AFM35]|uniref:hypothetical protein n=1 Tax=Halococcus sp. AFM35 TaxID=3421653 RepID=UPI003EB8D7DC
MPQTGRWLSCFALVVAFGAMLAFVGIFVTHLPAWLTPPHYPPTSPTYTPPFSESGFIFIPSEGWAALALSAVAWSVRGAIAHYWSTLNGHESTAD